MRRSDSSSSQKVLCIEWVEVLCGDLGDDRLV